jgi:hypothetical protein
MTGHHDDPQERMALAQDRDELDPGDVRQG